MKIETTKSYIASVNFHGRSFVRPEWTFSRTGDGTDLDIYAGDAIVIGNKGDRASQEWFIVIGEELVKVEDQAAASDAFHFAATCVCKANEVFGYKRIEDRDWSEVNAYVSNELKGYLA